jgi:hypothetical protein
MQQNDQERVIEKIKKLLAVVNSTATGNGVEHEQETAMRQAHALLAKHNLTMGDVLDEKEDRDLAVIAEEFPDPYRRVIAIAAANLFFCKFYWEQVPGKQKYKFCFVGLESNAETAKHMCIYLIQSVSRESDRQRKEQGTSAGWGTTFRNAAATRIAARCAAIRADAEADQTLNQSAIPGASNSRALTLVSHYENESKANDDFIEKILGINLKTKKLGGKLLDGGAAAKGDAYGRKVSLNKQVTGTPTPSAAALPKP